MAQFPMFQPLSFEQANPLLMGLQAGQQFGQNLQSFPLENQIRKIQAQYAPLTVPAEAMSKLAYASFVQPQFIAKLFNNPAFLAQLDSGQINQLKDIVTRSGNMPTTSDLYDLFLQGKSINPVSHQSGLNTANQEQYDNLLKGVKQAQSGLNQHKNVSANGYEYDRYGNNIRMSDEEVERRANAALESAAVSTTSVPASAASQVQQPIDDYSYFERAGKAAGIQKQLEKEGEVRATAEDELGQQYQFAYDAQKPIDELITITKNPLFQNMRKFPLFQGTQLKAVSKFGTKEEKQLIGQTVTSMIKAASDVVNSFRGRAMEKEFGFADRMKPSENDTFDVVVGKLEALSYYNKMSMERAKIAADLIRDKYLNRSQALVQADKMIDGNAIRKKIQRDMLPNPTQKDIEEMAKKYNKSENEIKEELKKKGYFLQIKVKGEY